MSERHIYAAYDDEGITVYQAYRATIVEAALANGTFGGGGFKMDRMTWIKPSFGWMLYRAGYGMKQDQERIVRVKLSHEGFQQALRWAVQSTWNRDLFASEEEWQVALRQSPVRVQWDPDRNLNGGKLERRAIQIGLRGKAVYAYVNQWIVGIEDATALAHSVKVAVDRKSEPPPVPEETVYPVSDELAQQLGMRG